ncbi:peptidase S8/S53 domain-containing protein [Radiomyces spectabilis]|uniref:peptidase S8/S53 domain-containing protein n=1 Tax=Radiomyces spectabilis TaxID=64574 RepID=UPI00221FEAE1|nr:peptidase S8/S53 domain-containing protein [Radiomyces spectabilis]KAI8391026.1 peptidase S8/S53 domain-containing protein [Radiomyces spectabilis]
MTSKPFLFLFFFLFSLVAGHSNQYIVQINRETCIKDFIPRMIDAAVDLIQDTVDDVMDAIDDLGKGHLARRTNKDPFHVFDTFDIAGEFKAISMEIRQHDVVPRLLSKFQEIVSIIPDKEIQFDLPLPESHSLDKRYYIRFANVKPHHEKPSTPRHHRKPKHHNDLEHDENCQHHPKNRSKQLATSYEAHSDEADPSSDDVVASSSSSSSSNKKSVTSKKKPSKSNSAKKQASTSKNKKNSSFKTKKSTKTQKSTKKSSKPSLKTASSSLSLLQQKNAPWNLVRISQHARSLNKPYIYDSNGGSGVEVYIIDDGLAIHHKDFHGRAKWGWSAFGKVNSQQRDGGGHGTHVAGIIGGTQYGVAKNVSMIAVQVLDENGRGTISNLLGGIQWVMKQVKKQPKSVLINMSLGMPKSGGNGKVLNDAVTAAVKAGIPIIAAAGNSASDACDIIPAGNPNVFAVAALDKNDRMDPKSCYGTCVQMLAPGVNVKSDYIGSKAATTTMSGSSMAAPHVTGVAALLLPHMDHPTPKLLYKALTDIATMKKAKNVQSKTPNAIVFNQAK